MERFKNCLYREVCDYETPCKQACVRYAVTKYMLEKSGIPKKLWGINSLIPEECDLKAFENLAYIRDNIEQFVEEGNSIYICSTNCGNGKTTWAIKLMLQYFNEVWDYTGFNARGLFLNVNEFLLKCKSSISKPSKDFDELKELIHKVDLVIWDDIGATKLSEYDYTLINEYVSYREFRGLSNIYTGNILPDELAEYVGTRLASRILNGLNCVTITLTGGDRRNGSVANNFSHLSI